jgi:hypothetical protein
LAEEVCCLITSSSVFTNCDIFIFSIAEFTECSAIGYQIITENSQTKSTNSISRERCLGGSVSIGRALSSSSLRASAQPLALSLTAALVDCSTDPTLSAAFSAAPETASLALSIPCEMFSLAWLAFSFTVSAASLAACFAVSTCSASFSPALAATSAIFSLAYSTLSWT